MVLAVPGGDAESSLADILESGGTTQGMRRRGRVSGRCDQA